MIDTILSIGTWPFRNLPGDNLLAITGHLQRLGITQAWTGSLEGLFHRDVAGVNLRLAKACEQAESGLLVPFGTINPTLPDWEDDLRRCDEVHKFRGIRVHPGFHGYDLNSEEFEKLLVRAAARKMIVQLVATMEDERTQHPVFRVPIVDLAPLPKLLKSMPSVRLIVLNGFRKLSLDEASNLANAGHAWFDIGMLEGVDRIAELSEKVSSRKILFGSNFPLFYIESALLKMRETMLPARIVEMVQSENASAILDTIR
jgi:predicted TIM-barrel fold metal-dependent hydrolase